MKRAPTVGRHCDTSGNLPEVIARLAATVSYRFGGVPVIAVLAFFLLPFHALAATGGRLADPTAKFFLLFAVLIAVVTFFFPKVGLAVMLFSMLFASDVSVGDDAGTRARAVTIRAEDVLLILISGGWLIRRATTRTLSIVKFVPANFPVVAMTVAILAASTLGYLQGTTPLNRGFLFTLKRLEYFWIFFMTLNIMDSDREGKICVKLLLGASAVIAVLGIIQHFLFPVAGGITTTAGYGRANTLGSFLLIVIGISFGIFIKADRRKCVPYFLLFSGLVLTLIFTKSRGAYVSMAPLMAVIAVLAWNQRFFTLVFGGGLVLALLIAGRLMIPTQAKALVTMHTNDIAHQVRSIGDVAVGGITADSSLNARFQFWRYSVREMVRYPILGQGVGSKALGTTDNQYVREMLETGLVGLCCFLYMNIVILTTSLRLYSDARDPIVSGLACGFFGGHVGMLVHGLTISNFYTILNMEVFWFVTALIMLFHHNMNTHGNYDAVSQLTTVRQSVARGAAVHCDTQKRPSL